MSNSTPSAQQITDSHWRLTWNGNALDVVLYESTDQGDGARELQVRLTDTENKMAVGRGEYQGLPDALRRADADIRVGPRQQSIDWQRGEAVLREDGLTLTLSSTQFPLQAVLNFTIHSSGALVRNTRIIHAGSGAAVAISAAPSFALTLPDAMEEVTFLSGEAQIETQINRLSLAHAPFYLQSRSGRTGFEYSPWIALSGGGVTLVAELMWSGNWHLAARQGEGNAYLSGGLPEHGFFHELRPGEYLDLPAAIVIRVAGNLDRATHILHDYRRAQRPDPDRNVPVQFNSWYPYPGEPDVATMLKFVTLAKRLNCEVFVLDAGWYTTEHEDPQENWWSRTGDWVVNRRLFPNGLTELSDACHAAGLGFGIWFEPEAISPNSIIAREYPDWLHHVNGQAPRPGKRAILNLGIDAAREFVRDRMFAVLRETGACWLKWDFNTDLRQGGWADAQNTIAHRDPLVAHYQGLYRLQDEIRHEFPDLILEMCSSGGGRFDGEIMRHAHTNWMSDQNQPLRNLAIHFGSQLAHPAVECNDWLIEWPPSSIKHFVSRGAKPDFRGGIEFRLMIAMLGSLGISAPVLDWSEQDIEAAAHLVRWYKEHVRSRINSADQYLLTPAPGLDGQGDWAAVWYADKDRLGGVGLIYRLEGNSRRLFALGGLDPARQYRIEFIDGSQRVETGTTLAAGLVLTLPEQFTATSFSVTAL